MKHSYETFTKKIKLDEQISIIKYFSQDLDKDIVGIYGDPKGLKSLGELLIRLSELDQKTIPDNNCPAHEGLHVHFSRSSALHNKSLGLDIGRIDAKSNGDTFWFLNN